MTYMHQRNSYHATVYFYSTHIARPKCLKIVPCHGFIALIHTVFIQIFTIFGSLKTLIASPPFVRLIQENLSLLPVPCALFDPFPHVAAL